MIRAADPVYAAEAARLGLDPDDAVRRYGELALDVISWRRFLAIGPEEPIELAVLPPKGSPWVAYPASAEHHLALAKQGNSLLANGLGVFTTLNAIRPEITARYPANRWCRADNGRASDAEIAVRRALYIDSDAERPKYISATGSEKAAAVALGDEIERILVEALGADCIGRGDSGNGRALFVALEPRPVTTEDTVKIQKLLGALAARYARPGVKIDCSVFNPARLVPCFGTWKTKGANTEERPHRRTYFSCRPVVRRVPMEALCP
jgi:hypothetical protein